MLLGGYIYTSGVKPRWSAGTPVTPVVGVRVVFARCAQCFEFLMSLLRVCRFVDAAVLCCIACRASLYYIVSGGAVEIGLHMIACLLLVRW